MKKNLFVSLAGALALAAPGLVDLRAQTPPDASPSPTAMPSPGQSPGYVEAFKPSDGQPLVERQTRTAGRITGRLVNGETQLLRNFTTLYQEVWHNSDGLTPQQVCDALGSRAANLFVIAGTMANALYQIDPAGIGNMVSVPAGYAATIHADGTVTVVKE